MLARVDRFPAPPSTTFIYRGESPLHVVPLLAAGAVAALLENQEDSSVLAKEAHALSTNYAHVIPPAALQRVGDHFLYVTQTVHSALHASPLLSFWWVRQPGPRIDREVLSGSESQRIPSGRPPSAPSIPSVDLITLDAAQSATSGHVKRVGKRLASAVKAMLISVQSLCRDHVSAARSRSPSVNAADHSAVFTAVTAQDGDDDEDGEGLSVMGTTLFEAHASSFEQARALKLWRCAEALNAVRSSLVEFTEANVANGWAGGAAPAGEAAVAVVGLLRQVLVLAEQVLCAGRAVLTGIVALNKVRRFIFCRWS